MIIGIYSMLIVIKGIYLLLVLKIDILLYLLFGFFWWRDIICWIYLSRVVMWNLVGVFGWGNDVYYLGLRESFV